MKSEAEDLIASSKQSLLDLKQAYALNPNTLAGGWLEKGQQFLGEAAGSKDPTIVNTRILNNLLGSQGLAKLKATFGGAPTEGERAILKVSALKLKKNAAQSSNALTECFRTASLVNNHVLIKSLRALTV
jgi:hypothetical protein